MITRNALCYTIAAILLGSSPALAQEGSSNERAPNTYAASKLRLLRSAESMPEERYGFKQAEVARTFSQIIGYAADAHARLCPSTLDFEVVPRNLEMSRIGKADLIDALKQAFSACDRMYGGVTPPRDSDMATLQREMASLSWLSANLVQQALRKSRLLTGSESMCQPGVNRLSCR